MCKHLVQVQKQRLEAELAETQAELAESQAALRRLQSERVPLVNQTAFACRLTQPALPLIKHVTYHVSSAFRTD